MTGFPQSILRFPRDHKAKPCEKPIDLLEYLIRTYSNEGDVVMDNTMGLGGTGVAAVQSGRRFIGIEIDRERFAIAKARITHLMASGGGCSKRVEGEGRVESLAA